MFDSLLGATKNTTETAEQPTFESVGDEYLNLRAEIDRLEAQAAVLLAKVDDERPYRADGYASVTAWLTHRGRMRRGRARRLVIEARALAVMPATSAAVRSGRISLDQTAELIRAHSAEPEQFPFYEDTLIAAADNVDWVSDLRTVCDYWRQAVSEPPSTDPDGQHDQRYLHISTTFEGMVKLDGLFDPKVGAQIIERIEAATPPPDGERSAAQRRADAATDLLLGYTTAPTTTVMVHLDDQRKLPRFEVGEMARGGVLDKSAIQRITCDTQIERIIHSPDGRILEHGRAKRTISPAMKRALIGRDRHCRFPGCQRPPWWTEGHHIEHWSKGGPTNLDNLILLCRHHHTSVHEHGFTIEGPGHDPTFRRRDRTILEWHPPPPG